MSVATRITELQKIIPGEVKLVAVSKTHPAGMILEAYNAGQRAFGESRPQELAAKQKELPADIEWHMIGHLQRNKVRKIIPFVSMIHSVDSGRLLETIDEEAARADRVVDILFEVRIGLEATKHGWTAEELFYYLAGIEKSDYANVRFRGVMGIASNTTDEARIRAEFTSLRVVFDTLKKNFFGPGFDTVSMGMTSDYKLAIECGSNLVRIGSLIFSER
ncbi:MAG: YggS family pyridoxal phosphate-dependent enzyme [Rikenellaceae bacterium]|jgi:pyridoxal phosphate enzyme (YggS family)|nr:YggS family pyridoxal phosphate-dependent enzyme [Rikenellaceae bacterium]